MNPEQLDPKIVSLARAIRETESRSNFAATGKSGENGAYQFMPETWRVWSKKHLGVENAPLTPQNQNKVAYKQIEEWAKQGYNPGQIASMWNSGSPDPTGKVGVNKYGVKYDTPRYVQEVYSRYQQFKGVPTANAATEQPTASAQPQQSFLGNVVSSGARFLGDTAKGIANVFNPNLQQNTIANVGRLGLGVAEKFIPGQQAHEETANAVGAFYKDRYGGLENIKKTLYEDPVGAAADASVLLGGAGLALKGTSAGAKVAALGRAVDPINVISKPIGAIANLANKGLAAGVGVPSRLGYSSAQDILRASKAGGSSLDQMTSAARGSVSPQNFVDDLSNAVDTLKKQKSADYETALSSIDSNYRQTNLKQGSNASAKVYQRATGETFPLSTQGPKGALTRTLNEFTIKADKSGKLDFSNSPIPRTDYGRVQNIADDLRDWTDFTPRGLNNLENKIRGYYIATEGRKSIGNRVVLQASGDIKAYLRKRIPEFAAADDAYQKTSKLLSSFKRDLSLGGKAGPETILRKVRKAATTDDDLRAGLIQELNKLTDKDLSAVATGLKSQSWTPSGLLAGASGIGSFVHPQLLVALAFSSPRLAFEFLRTLGVAERKASAIANAIRKSRAGIIGAQSQRVNDAQNPRQPSRPVSPLGRTPTPR